MKRTLIYISFLIGLCSCVSTLDTQPTVDISTSKLETEEGLQVALDGIYASMYRRIDFLSLNTHHTFGNMALTLAAELMGEDMVQTAKGPGWFWNDYTYGVRQRYASNIQRCYFVWKYYYELINNANWIISMEGKASGDEDKLSNIFGQAYAVRAYCYFMLAQFFQQTFVGNEDKPGVPIYTEPTTASSKAMGRGTLAEVFGLIVNDLDHSLELMKATSAVQDHTSHLDIYAINVIYARVALVMNDWKRAEECAEFATGKPGCRVLTRAEASVTKGTYTSDSYTTGKTPFNTIDSPDVMWGAEILTSQSNVYATFFSMMDACTNVYYACESPKCISNWLWSEIPDSDIRKGWWNGNIGHPASTWSRGANINYNQHKFQWKNQSTLEGDYIFMRVEEAYLILAEALCRQEKYEESREALAAVCNQRDLNSKTRMSMMKNSTEIASSTTESPRTLLDEIIFQRRVELWGEAGRIHDIHRLGQTWTRSWTVGGEESNHTDMLSRYAEYQAFPSDYIETILLIPQGELDINPNIGPEDQNPYAL